jgi:NAD(P)-dependent dehydrogenase (short-subunit alcohol dehydrogenase family)
MGARREVGREPKTKGGVSMRLKDKVAIITAGGSGVGRAGTVIFAREGAKVVVADIDPEGGKESVGIVKDAGGEAFFVQTDVTRVEQVKNMVETAAKVYGKLDILWNHAGIPGPGSLESTEEEEFDRTLSLNVKGGFFATKYAVPHMIKTGGGSILFTASISALRASPTSPTYALSKGALVPLTMSLAASLGPHKIRTNCICPGPIHTPMLEGFLNRGGVTDPEFMENVIKMAEQKCPLGRLTYAEDVAYAALYLASDEAAYVNGVIFPVDGGMIVK